MKLDLREIESFNFPDGQPHVTVKHSAWQDDGFVTPKVVASITSSDDLMKLLLVKSILDEQGFRGVGLKITYLMGARMDRAIDVDSPFTLRVVADLINNAGFLRVSIFDPHSDVATALLNARAVLPIKYVSLALTRVSKPIVLIPDAGAVKRTGAILEQLKYTGDTVQALKHRDMATGKLSGFEILDPKKVTDRNVLIVDDLCDGGGTFAGLADLCIRYGSKSVTLYVSHGVFSKGLDIPGIDRILTTDSYGTREAGVFEDGRVIVDAL